MKKYMPFALAIGLLLSISTALRSTLFPVGPGEFLLAILTVMGLLYGRSWRLLKKPVVLFWLVSFTGMIYGGLKGGGGAWAQHHAMAYAFTGFVSIGLCALMTTFSDSMLKRVIYWLCILAVVTMWLGFGVYLSNDPQLTQMLHMADEGDLRYSGWSLNPNQLALFFVPLPVWLAAQWRSFTKPNPYQIACFGLTLFGLMLMGLLVRSDGLFVVWICEFVILVVLRFRWEMKSSRMSLLGYALVLILCVVLVKSFAHGQVRNSVRCAVQSLGQAEVGWLTNCYDEQAFKDQEAFRIGFSNPVEKTGVRQQLWMHGLEAWVESPWVGYGPGEYSWIPAGGSVGSIKVMESHNITIDLLTQGGIMSGGAWLALVSCLLIGAWRVRDSYTFSVVLMMAAFTFFHNTRQPYLWFVLAFSYEAIRRKLFVSPTYSR